ncbi:hypothetical protein ACX1DX_09640 [Tessaracoccus sp. Y36]
MSNDQYPPSEPQPQPYGTPRGPEFGGPSYDPYLEDPFTAPTPPPAQPVPTYLPPAASPAPVVPPTPQQPPYGYPVPYQQPMQPPPQPYYGYQLAKPEHPSSVAVLVLGVLSVFVVVTAPFAWYMGSKAKKEIALGAPYQWGAGGQVGWVLGIIYSVFMMLFAALIMLGIMASM